MVQLIFILNKVIGSVRITKGKSNTYLLFTSPHRADYPATPY